ncbi:MAG: glycosyltransferase family 9 protein [Croceitalea sp.]|nr:glycosyltransferase family 9 protein [Croceitalea sp.]
MGDVAMLVPVLMALTSKYPDLRITLLTRKRFEVIFSQVPHLKIIHAEVKGKHKGLLGIIKLFKQLKGLHFDAIVDAHNVLRTNILKFLFQFKAVPFVQINKGRSEKKALVRYKNKVFKPLKTTHKRYADLLSEIGYPIDLSLHCVLDKPKMATNIKTLIGPYEHLVAIAPFAAYQSKIYPLEQLQLVIKTLIANKNLKIVLFGGGTKEIDQLNMLEQSCTDQLFNMAGKLSFEEELNLIANVDVMLAMDSGNGHLAANYGVPVVTLWGVTHPYAGFAPFLQKSENSLVADISKYPVIPTSVYGNTYPEGYEYAIASIDPISISNRIQELLKNT